MVVEYSADAILSEETNAGGIENKIDFQSEKIDRSGYSHGNQLGSRHYTFPLDLDSDENGHIINFYFLRRIDSDGNLVDKRGKGGDVGLLKRNGEPVSGRKFRGSGRFSQVKSALANTKLVPAPVLPSAPTEVFVKDNTLSAITVLALPLSTSRIVAVAAV